MKKLLLYLCFVGLSIGTAYSQFIAKNAILASGAVGFSALKDSETDFKRNSTTLMPWAGYSVMDNLVAGVFLNYTSTKRKEDPYVYTDTDLFVGPLVRYYHSKGVFGHAQVGFGSSKSKSEFNGNSASTTNDLFGWAAGAGYAIRIADVALFEPVVLFQSTKTTTSLSSSTDSGIAFMGSFTIFLKRP